MADYSLFGQIIQNLALVDIQYSRRGSNNTSQALGLNRSSSAARTPLCFSHPRGTKTILFSDRLRTPCRRRPLLRECLTRLPERVDTKYNREDCANYPRKCSNSDRLLALFTLRTRLGSIRVKISAAVRVVRKRTTIKC